MEKTTFLLSAGLVGVLALDLGLASDLPVQKVPFELHGHFIVVKGSIGSLDDLNLIIDSGASFTTLSPGVAKRLGLKGKKKEVNAHARAVTVEQVEIPAVKLGSMEFGPAAGWVARLSFPDKNIRSLRIDALIGLDLLKRTSLTIDYESEILRFGPVSSGPGFVPFYPGLSVVPVSIYVQDQHLRLLLDTGAADLILFEPRTAGRIRMEKTWDQKEIRGEGGKATLWMVRLKDASMGDASWDVLTAYVLNGRAPRSGLDGILGPLALGCKRLHLDFSNNLIGWE